MERFISTKGTPIHCHALQLALDRLQVAKAEFKSLEYMDTICQSSSPWTSPLHMVPKNDGVWHLCENCTTAAIQIKGTARWLYCVDMEYQLSQQIVVVRPC